METYIDFLGIPDYMIVGEYVVLLLILPYDDAGTQPPVPKLPRSFLVPLWIPKKIVKPGKVPGIRCSLFLDFHYVDHNYHR